MPPDLPSRSQDEEALLPGFAVGAEEAEAVRAHRRYDYAARRVPLMRAMGFALLALALALHNRLVPGSGSAVDSGRFVAVALPYCLLSWLSLRRWYGRLPFDLMVFWQSADFVVRTLALYASGGPRSWLFPVLLTGIYDNVLISFRQTLRGTLFTVVLYVGMLGWIRVHDGVAVPWGQEATKLAVLLATGAYLLENARLAERLRERRRQAVGLSRELIRQTRAQAEALERAKLQAEEQSRSKSQFLAGMSHELRTPLNAILLYSELLETEAEEAANGQVLGDAHRIRSAGRHLLELVNDLLDLSKIEAGKMDLHPEPFTLGDLVAEIQAAMAGLVEKGGNRLEVLLPEGDQVLVADALRVRQILLNLLGNAAKFTERGLITLRARREGAEAVFEVQDSGIGMDREQLGRIFSDFVQAGPDTSKKYGGTGLGLSLSQKLCALMGGSITVESEPGKGSLFRVRIPQASA